MKYSNHLEVDVVSHLWAAILKNSQYSTHLYNLALIRLDLYALKLGIGQTKQTEIWVLARPNRPKYGYWPDRTDQNLGIGQTEQTKIWVMARPNRPKYGYWPDETDRNMGIRQTEQTKIAIGQTEGVTQIFSRPLWTVAPDPPVRDPSRSGQYLSWVADFILGENFWRLSRTAKRFEILGQNSEVTSTESLNHA